MDADIGYDTSNFQTLRQELEQLNAAALESGLLPPVTDWFATSGPGAKPKRAKARPDPVAAVEPAAKGKAKGKGKTKAAAKAADAERPAVAPADRGKAMATRLLTMLRRAAGDESPDVPGTAFTESGVVRLLAHLRRPRSRRVRFLQRLRRFLARPVALGLQTSAGVGVERLQMISHRLGEIERHGLLYVRSVRAARRGRPLPGSAPPD